MWRCILPESLVAVKLKLSSVEIWIAENLVELPPKQLIEIKLLHG
jgi:hypothetical protein